MPRTKGVSEHELEARTMETADAEETANGDRVWSSEPTPQAIRERAFQIFVARGGKPGSDVDDWMQAEKELTSAPRPHRKN